MFLFYFGCLFVWVFRFAANADSSPYKPCVSHTGLLFISSEEARGIWESFYWGRCASVERQSPPNMTRWFSRHLTVGFWLHSLILICGRTQFGFLVIINELISSFWVSPGLKSCPPTNSYIKICTKGVRYVGFSVWMSKHP